MQRIGDKGLCLLVELILLVIQTANLFLGNIAVYEASTGLQFDFSALLKNRVFWVAVFIQILFFCTSCYIRKVNKETDEVVEKAYAEMIPDLARQVAEYSSKGDFVSANKVRKLLTKVRRR